MLRPYFIAVLLFISISVPSCSGHGGDEALQFSEDSEVRQIRPEKPVRISLKRHADGRYTWDITGDEPEKVVEADKKLRGLLGIKNAP